jgi:uncharacterized repeat protein (TIGR03803 family)
MRRNVLSLGSISLAVITTLAVFVTAMANVPAAAQSEKILHSFTGGADGIAPSGGVVFDSAGRLYGTTCRGGTYGSGVVYQMAQSRGGVWSERIIHAFNGPAGDGVCPSSSLMIDKAGNIYGVAGGGRDSVGLVFELSPSAIGSGWAYKLLHSFTYNGKDGYYPYGGLVMDAAGNLYGTTQQGPNNCPGTAFGCSGTVFELSPAANGSWRETTLYSFPIGYDWTIPDGGGPLGSLILDAAGNLYGTAQGGGAYGGGVVFELSPSGIGTWNATVLHSFQYDAIDLRTLWGGVAFDRSGNLYGCTQSGALTMTAASSSYRQQGIARGPKPPFMISRVSQPSQAKPMMASTANGKLQFSIRRATSMA